MNIPNALTDIGQSLAWLDQAEGLVSNLRLSAEPVAENPQALLGLMNAIENQTRPILDAIRTALHQARKNLDGE